MKSIPSLLAILISSLAIFTQTNANIGYAESSDHGHRPSWLTDSHRNRVELFKKWLENKPTGNSIDGRSPSSPYNALESTHQFKGACYCHLFSLGKIFNLLTKNNLYKNDLNYLLRINFVLNVQMSLNKKKRMFMII
jgi:DNA repair photolyase